MGERWADVLGYAGVYEVSDAGNVRLRTNTRRNKAGHLLKQTVATNGYLAVSLATDGSFRRKYVHRLVAEAFLGPSLGREVNHKNGDKADNRVENLEWVTHAQNQEHAQTVLRRWVGRRGASRKLTDEQVREIRASSEPQRVLADKYGISQPAVVQIRKRRTYKEVADAEQE